MRGRNRCCDSKAERQRGEDPRKPIPKRTRQSDFTLDRPVQEVDGGPAHEGQAAESTEGAGEAGGDAGEWWDRRGEGRVTGPHHHPHAGRLHPPATRDVHRRHCLRRGAAGLPIPFCRAYPRQPLARRRRILSFFI